MAELFLSKFPSEVVTRPVDAERDKLLRDWEPSRRERLEQRWDKVMHVGKDALALAGVTGVFAAAILGGRALTLSMDKASDSNVPVTVPTMISQQAAANEVLNQAAADEMAQSGPGDPEAVDQTP